MAKIHEKPAYAAASVALSNGLRHHGIAFESGLCCVHGVAGRNGLGWQDVSRSKPEPRCFSLQTGCDGLSVW